MNGLDDWISLDAQEERKRQAEGMANSGMKPFLRLEEGETSFEVDRKVRRREIQTGNGPRKVLSLLNPVDKELCCTDYLYGVIVEQLDKQLDGRIRLLRTGSGKQTKYKCLELR